ncbi:E3 ubiquitin-protein ligase TRIM32-like [Hyperolius riggenbachi]|uniref:E3 ubiquitin-protein ligase TRIM32-like n=1 Tax=Hyperolius riggenbachi TaxID=752182 RepID=UPI0035A3ABF7
MLSTRLHELLHCAICTERYSETDRRPKLLCCGHTFCGNCLEKLFCDTLLLPANEHDPALRCPSCRQTTPMLNVWRVPHLSDNFAIINFLTAEETHKQYCKKHKDEKLDFFCYQCQRLLCPSCALQHMAKKLHKAENVESAALKYRQHIHLAINDCKEKQDRLDEIIQEAELEKLKLGSLSKSLKNIAIIASDLELLFHKPILKTLNDYSINALPSENTQTVPLRMRKAESKIGCLSPPAYWCI